jgi:hypothetical protein
MWVVLLQGIHFVSDGTKKTILCISSNRLFREEHHPPLQPSHYSLSISEANPLFIFLTAPGLFFLSHIEKKHETKPYICTRVKIDQRNTHIFINKTSISQISDIIDV